MPSSGIGLSGYFEAHSPTCIHAPRDALMRLPPNRALLPEITYASDFGQCQLETSISTSSLRSCSVILTVRCVYGTDYMEADWVFATPATAWSAAVDSSGDQPVLSGEISPPTDIKPDGVSTAVGRF